MKPRPVHSFARAIKHIIDAIGEDSAAAAVERSPSLIRKWSDPDHSSAPTIHQAFALDAAYLRETQKPPLIMTTYLRRLDAAIKNSSKFDEDMIVSLLNVQSAVGEMAGRMNEVLNALASPDAKLSNNQKHTLFDCVEQLAEEVADLERAISNR